MNNQPTFDFTLFNQKEKCIDVNVSRNINGNFIFKIDLIDFQYEIVFHHKPNRETVFNEIIQMDIPEDSIIATLLFKQFLKCAQKNKGAFFLKLFNAINAVKYCYAKNPHFILNKNAVFTLEWSESLSVNFHFFYRNNKDVVLVQCFNKGVTKSKEFSYGNYSIATLIQIFNETIQFIPWVDKNKIKDISNFVQKTAIENKDDLEFMLNRFNNKLKLA